MQFFMQSLAKRKLLKHETVNLLDRYLMMLKIGMGIYTVVQAHVDWRICAVSLGLNLLNRGNDFINVAAIGTFFYFYNVQS